MAKTFYITTPIYYVNARPHIGHAYTTIACDVIARRQRMLGFDTYFLTGTDEHGQKIERAAQAAGKTPQQFADEVSAEFRSLWDRMGLTYDDYIRTTSERHKVGMQAFWRRIRDNGYIYEGTFTGQYCVSDEAYVDGAKPGDPCPTCGRITETVKEENYFFKLSAFEDKLLKLYGEADFIRPEARRNEVISFVRSGLRDLSISRSTLAWGIPVPDDPKHVIYVWLDALANYITALGYGSGDTSKYDKYWPADVHMIGKEIVRFHCVYWPAFLMAAGLPLPKAIVAHGWLLFEHSKMSKSRGNIVRAETILEVLGADALRYFLLREVVFGQDGSFSFDALVQRYNADLANGYGNLVSRTLTMIGKYFDGVVPDGELEPRIRQAADAAATAYKERFEDMDFSRALESLWTLVGTVDGYITEQAPWKLGAKMEDAANRKQLAGILATCAEAIRIITGLVYPILPESAAKIWLQLGLGDIQNAVKSGELANLKWGGLKPGTKLGELSPVFPRAEKDAITRMHDLEQNNESNPVPETKTPATTGPTASETPAES